MTESIVSLTEEYSAALRTYLETAGEETLQTAYELGRKALAEGMGVLDMAKVHEHACVGLAGSGLVSLDKQRQNHAVEAFFTEALLPFEAQHRGFHEANARLQVLNEALASWNPQIGRAHV